SSAGRSDHCAGVADETQLVYRRHGGWNDSARRAAKHGEARRLDGCRGEGQPLRVRLSAADGGGRHHACRARRGPDPTTLVMTTAAVIGSTGLVGTELVKVLLATPYYNSVLVLNRRPAAAAHPKLSEQIIDFDAPDLEGVFAEHLYCALGTTLRRAGSHAAQ